MRVAIIDLGTNSVRFDVHQLGPKKSTRELHREKLMVRLGQGVFSDGRLNAEAIRRTINAFISFERTARELHATRIVAFGTAALREAVDGPRLLEQIHEKTGIEVRVISGAEEAKLIALGVLRNEKAQKGRFGLIDIGGGSTEISVCRGKEMLIGDSFPLGTARLQQVFLRTSPPRALANSKDDPILHVRKYIRSTLLPKMITDEWPKVDRLLGSSGTIRSLLKLARAGKPKGKKNGKTLDRGDLKKMVQAMSTMTTSELLSMPGMEAKRVDMILAGAILLDECMTAVKAKKVATTEYSLRDGILEEQIDLYHREKISSIGLKLEDLKERVTRFYASRQHIDQVTALSGHLFDLTRKLHKLPVNWRSYLQAAAILHDIGEIISPTNHEEHSYYFVKNMDAFVNESWEAEFLAQLCRWHRVGKPNLPNFGKENAKKKAAFIKLLALLRLSDAMDRSHRSHLILKSVRLSKGQVEIIVGGKSTPDLELLRVDQKKGLFEEVFKRKLRVVYRRSAKR